VSRIQWTSPRAAAGALGVVLLAWLAPEFAGGQIMVPSDDPAHPRIQYADSLVSMNDRCPVRGGRLSPNYAPVYVNGRPIGFC
jgi:hypothetical protein